MQKRKQVTITCGGCQLKISKAASEVSRNAAKGRLSYCSRGCAAKKINNLGAFRGVGNYSIKQHANNQLDDLSPFRHPTRKSRSRNLKKGFDKTDITPEYLKNLWDQQAGICPFTGWKMHLPASSLEWEEAVTPRTASLDRIVAREPYRQGNVRFVAHIANMAKYTYTDQDVITFCKAVTARSSLCV